MQRITNKTLEAMIERLNNMTGNPTEAYTKKGDRYEANVGNYHLDGAYGGVTIYQMSSEGGGVTDPLSLGHVTKRELYNALHCFMRGIQLGQQT